MHQLGTAMTELQATKNTWFQKTLTSLKERTGSTSGSIAGGTVTASGVPSSGLQRQHSKDNS